MFFRSTLIAHKTARKPYFMGLVVHKEIIQTNIRKEQISPKTSSFRGFLYILIIPSDATKYISASSCQLSPAGLI